MNDDIYFNLKNEIKILINFQNSFILFFLIVFSVKIKMSVRSSKNTSGRGSSEKGKSALLKNSKAKGNKMKANKK